MRWILNRYALTFIAVVLAVGAWNAAVALNNDGIIAGRVVDASGAPIADAEVVLRSNELTARSAAPIRTRTNADGSFIFDGITYFDFKLSADAGRLKTRAPISFHLYWRAQNLVIREPVVVVEAANG